MTIRDSAPGNLALIERFLRTRHEVVDAASLSAWLAQEGLAASAPQGLAKRVIWLREALRELMWANNGGPAAPGALKTLNAEAKRVGLGVRASARGTPVYVWKAGRGEQVVAPILAAVLAAMADGSWNRMKACAAEDCRYAFYDHTKNRSGRWCDVAGCGVNFRMRQYRRRLAPRARVSDS